MKFEIKTEPVCAVLVAIPAYFSIVVITLGTGVQARFLVSDHSHHDNSYHRNILRLHKIS
jgi:hypothetical protein